MFGYANFSLILIPSESAMFSLRRDGPYSGDTTETMSPARAPEKRDDGGVGAWCKNEKEPVFCTLCSTSCKRIILSPGNWGLCVRGNCNEFPYEVQGMLADIPWITLNERYVNIYI